MLGKYLQTRICMTAGLGTKSVGINIAVFAVSGHRADAAVPALKIKFIQ